MENNQIDEKIKSYIKSLKRRFTEKLQKENDIKIFILGSGFPDIRKCLEQSCESCGNEKCVEPKRRKKVRDALRCLNIISIFPEECSLLHPVIEQEFIFENEDVDQIIILSEDPRGSAHELGIYSKDKLIAPKLRVFVPTKYHPLEDPFDTHFNNPLDYLSLLGDQSFMTNAYLTHLTKYGHVYAFKNENELLRKIMLLSHCYKIIKIN